MFDDFLELTRTDDRQVYAEVVTDDCYRLRDLLRDGILSAAPFVIDVGAHVGCFAAFARHLWPAAQIVCCECCPENVPILRRNVGDWAAVIAKAVTYEPGEVFLLNTCLPGGPSTCGSEVLPLDVIKGHQHNPNHYWRDFRPLEKITLDEIAKGRARIDLLKLDCEGSEFSILHNAHCLNSVRVIVGEWHGRAKWVDLIESRFRSWGVDVIRDGENGLFRLFNPNPPA